MDTPQRVHKPVIDAELIAAVERLARASEDGDRPEGGFTSQEFADAIGRSKTHACSLLRQAVGAGELTAAKGMTTNVVGSRQWTVYYARKI